jgi:AraC-like DNA-binding protein
MPMPTLPVPMFAALVLGFLAVRARARGDTPRPILLLIVACAVQAAAVAGRLHYGVEAFSWVQPVLAMGLPPLAWVAFVSATRRPLVTADLWHMAGPAFAIFCRTLVPDALDLAIPVSFLAYGLAILLALRTGGEIVHARLGAEDRTLRLWRWVGVALIASFLSDLLIMGAVTLGHRDWTGWIVTVFSTGTLLALGGLMLAEEAATVAEADDAPAVTEGDVALVAAMEQLMAAKRLWLDPDLTLARIARRMAVPSKALSAAVNRVKGENISRVVNGWRIRHAADLLRDGRSVTEAMLTSGFSTKSNFNREFLRVMGQAPSDWVKRPDSQDVGDKLLAATR